MIEDLDFDVYDMTTGQYVETFSISATQTELGGVYVPVQEDWEVMLTEYAGMNVLIQIKDPHISVKGFDDKGTYILEAKCEENNAQ